MSRIVPALRPALERLEVRENPSAVWTTEAFDGGAAPALPAGWANWSNDGEQRYITSKLTSVSGTTSLASLGSTATASRFWNVTTVPGDYGAALSLRGGTSAKMDLIARGTQLDTTGASYLAAEFNGTRGFELFEVRDGVSKSLGQISSKNSLTGKWVRVSLQPSGEWAGLTVQRLDTGAFLKSDGNWQADEVEALRLRTSIAAGEGVVGIGRRAGNSGMAYTDDFAVLVPSGVKQAFDTTAAASVPTNWQTWTNNHPVAFAVGTTRSLSTAQAMTSNGASNTESRAWLGTAIAADASATAAVYADSLVPAGVFVRGRGLATAQPSYYSLTLTRGLNVQIKRVEAGVETVLGAVRSADYVSGKWIRATLVAEGNTLRAIVFRADTNRWLKVDGTWSATPVTALQTTDARITGSGLAGITRGRGASGGVWIDDFEVRPASASAAVSITPTAPPVRPTEIGEPTPRTDIAQKYTHIRLAQLAYHGNPVGQYETDLAARSLDLIIPNPIYLQAFETAAPGTTKVIYTNSSNIYGPLLPEWNAFADARGIAREQAFYHVAQATAFSRASQSAQAVNLLWNVQRANADGTGTPVDLTAQARGTRAQGVGFGASGTAIVLGFIEKFRELNFDLSKVARPAWRGVIEYVSDVNADGSPATWKTLAPLQDGTDGLRSSGTITFDPPADWVASKVAGGAARLHQVRIRTTAGPAAQAPVARTILGRDYVGARGTDSGTIPAFDSTADTDRNGYLSDTEYRNRRAGFDARFEYESRLFYPNYGQMRFMVNPSSAAIKQWNVEYHLKFLQQNPQADGLFIDNSHGKLPFVGTPVLEPVASFTQEFAALIGAITKAVAPKWTVSNTAGSIEEGDPVTRASTAAFEEFALRPNTSSWATVRDIADLLARRLNSDNPSPYVILDTYSGNAVAVNDPRSQMASLAYYYLLADPDKTFLMFNGGQEPAAPWQSVFVPAATVDVGRPTGAMTTWMTGLDPESPALTYQVLRREYANAVVLHKPLSYKIATGTGTRSDATATTHDLGGNFRRLNPDGSRGPLIASITLRGGEGAVLMRV